MKLLGRIGAALVLVLIFALAGLTNVSAYDGHGSDNLPCADGGYWVINQLDGTAPVLTVDGVVATFVKLVGNGTTAHYESGPVTADSVVTVTPDIGQLQLSHCIGGASSEPSSQPSEQPSESPSESPTPSSSPTSTPPSATPTPTPSPSAIDVIVSPNPNPGCPVCPPATDTDPATAILSSTSPFGLVVAFLVFAGAVGFGFSETTLRRRRRRE